MGEIINEWNHHQSFFRFPSSLGWTWNKAGIFFSFSFFHGDIFPINEENSWIILRFQKNSEVIRSDEFRSNSIVWVAKPLSADTSVFLNCAVRFPFKMFSKKNIWFFFFTIYWNFLSAIMAIDSNLISLSSATLSFESSALRTTDLFLGSGIHQNYELSR